MSSTEIKYILCHSCKEKIYMRNYKGGIEIRECYKCEKITPVQESMVQQKFLNKEDLYKVKKQINDGY